MSDYNTIEASTYNEVWHGFFSETGSQMQLAEEIILLKAERGANTRESNASFWEVDAEYLQRQCCN